ncbi:MAG: hypothetical protein ACRDYC_09140 [Acidimicrobiales bacterium]
MKQADRADRELEAGIDRGTLYGIPVGVKDILAMAEGPARRTALSSTVLGVPTG